MPAFTMTTIRSAARLALAVALLACPAARGYDTEDTITPIGDNIATRDDVLPDNGGPGFNGHAARFQRQKQTDEMTMGVQARIEAKVHSAMAPMEMLTEMLVGDRRATNRAMRAEKERFFKPGYRFMQQRKPRDPTMSSASSNCVVNCGGKAAAFPEMEDER